MAKFINGFKLNDELELILKEADERLILISPYIKLHSNFKDALKSKIQNYKLHITLVFGKSENDLTKSITQDDFNFLSQFPNIEIKYEPRLHAKYYANDFYSLLCTMNLYDYSQNNNIEAGILLERTILGTISSKLEVYKTIDNEQHSYFETVIKNSSLLFQNIPITKGLLIKEYSHTENKIDKLTSLFTPKQTTFKEIAKHFGYCIATGVEISFNPEVPFSKEAYRKWSKNKDEPQNYCHYSGEQTNEVSFFKPICRKNWSKAKSLI